MGTSTLHQVVAAAVEDQVQVDGQLDQVAGGPPNWPAWPRPW